MQYITLEELETLSLDELRKKKESLYAILIAQESNFTEKKEDILTRISHIINWYILTYQPLPNSLNTKITLLIAYCEDAKSNDELAARIRTHIQELQNLEIHLKIEQADSLSCRLCDLYEILCFEGLLFRDFVLQVKPLILQEIEDTRKSFSKDATGVIIHSTQEQIEILNTLEDIGIGCALTEEHAKSAIMESIAAVEQLIVKEKQKKYKISYMLSCTVGLETNEILKNNLLILENKLKEKQYLSAPAYYPYHIAELKEAIGNIDNTIEMRTCKFEEQKRWLLSQYQAEFYALKQHTESLMAIQQFMADQEIFFKKIPANINWNDEKNTILELKQHYAKFWENLSETTVYYACHQKNSYCAEWISFHENLLKTRKNLQKKGILFVTFAHDKRHIIIDRFDKTLQETYGKSWWVLGEFRDIQLQTLRRNLCKSTSEREAGMAIEKAISQIEQHHQLTSILYNLVPFRKKSRAALALRKFSDDCQAYGLLPKTAALPLTVITPIIEAFKIATENYFSNDILFSNRSYRFYTTALINYIQLVDTQLRENKITQADAEQLVVDYVEETIEHIRNIEKSNLSEKLPKCVKRILQFSVSTEDTLANYLELEKGNLHKQKRLAFSYQRVIYPKIYQLLRPVIDAYEKEGQGINAMLQSVFSENKIQGAHDANELLANLRDEVVNADQASLMLESTILALANTYPDLINRIKKAIQPLREEAILPAIALGEFSIFIRDKVKAESKKISELKLVISDLARTRHKINRLPRPIIVHKVPC